MNHASQLKLGMHADTDRVYNTSKSLEDWIIFVDVKHQKNLVYEKILSIFQSNLPPEEDITKK